MYVVLPLCKIRQTCEKKYDTVERIRESNVSESDILGPIDYLSDIENLVSFERTVCEDYSFKYRTKIFLLFILISLL